MVRALPEKRNRFPWVIDKFLINRKEDLLGLRTNDQVDHLFLCKEVMFRKDTLDAPIQRWVRIHPSFKLCVSFKIDRVRVGRIEAINETNVHLATAFRGFQLDEINKHLFGAAKRGKRGTWVIDLALKAARATPPLLHLGVKKGKCLGPPLTLLLGCQGGRNGEKLDKVFPHGYRVKGFNVAQLAWDGGTSSIGTIKTLGAKMAHDTASLVNRDAHLFGGHICPVVDR